MFQALPPVFAGLSMEESQDAARFLQQIEVPAGTAIMMEGENDQTLAFIVKGSVEVWMGETRVATAAGREMIGEMELFYPMPRACSITATHDTTLQIFTPEAFAELCALSNPVVYHIERFAIRRLSDRLQALNQSITTRSEGGSLLSLNPKKPGLLRRLFGGSGKNRAAELAPVEVLVRSEMFNWADQTLVEAFAANFKPVSFDVDEVICSQDEDGDEMWVIGDGEVEIALMTDDENAETIGRLGPGHAFGDSSIVMHAQRTATCIARTPVSALSLDRSTYLELHGLDDAVGSTFRQGMIRNLVIQLLATTRRYVALQPSLKPDTEADGREVWR